MENFVFFTYVLALISLVVSLYALYSVECIKENTKKTITKKPRQVKPPVKVQRAKGHWD